jgi:beta-N-acetylhexosaminidase
LVGEIIIMGFEGTEVSPELGEMLTRIQPGGLVLFARNIQTPQQTWELLRECQKLVSVPMFLCVDMEGGKVDRFRNVLGPSPSAADVFATADKKLFYQHGKNIGEAVRALGFNTDFAPVVDLGFKASQTVLASRTVSADPKKTITYARALLQGLSDAGVLGCGKHFPGLGEGNLDSHHDLPVIQKSWKKLWDQDLVPYRRMRSEFPFVLVSHAAYPAVTGNSTPASLSRKLITDVLRKKIRYEGLILPDDMEMGALLSTISIEDAAIETLRAGSDMLLICRNQDHVQLAYDSVLWQAQRDRGFAKCVSDAYQRVLAFKKQVRLKRPGSPPKEARLQRISRELWELGEQLRLQAVGKETA